MREEIRALIGARLKSERERLGLAQEDLASIAGASRRSVVEWDRGATVPGADALALLAQKGVDVPYVVVGVRGETSSSTLSPDEVALVDDYRKTTSEHQRTLRDVGAVFAQAASHQPASATASGGTSDMPGELVRSKARKLQREA